MNILIATFVGGVMSVVVTFVGVNAVNANDPQPVSDSVLYGYGSK